MVFYNLKETHGYLAEKISALKCISRVYGSAKQESYDRYEQLVNDTMNFIAFYNYKLPTEADKGQGEHALKNGGL